MSLSIHGMKFAEYDAAKVSQALRQLPVDTVSNQTAEGFSPDRTEGIIEEEYAFLDISKNPNTQFLATRHVGDCLVLYIYNDSGERCLIHHIPGRGPRWEAIFNHFKDKKVKLVFWGGRPLQPHPALVSMTSILNHLIDFTRQHPEVKVDIIRHRFASFNAPQKGEMAQAVTHFLQDRFILAFKLHLSEPFERKVNVADPAQNFPETALPQDAVQRATELVFSDPVRWPELLGNRLTAAALNGIAAIAFSKQGFAQISITIEKHKFTYLTNFAVHLENHRVFPCPVLALANEPLRQAFLFSKAFQSSVDYRAAGEPIYFPEPFIRLCHDFSKKDALSKIQNAPNPIPEFLQAFNMLKNTGSPDADWLENMRIQKNLVEILLYYRTHVGEFTSLKLHQEESLRLASAFGLADRVRQLLHERQQCGFDHNACDHLQRTALHYGVMRQRLVQDLLTKDNLARFCLPANYSSEECLKGHSDVVKALLAAELKVDCKNSNGLSPLQIAQRDADSKDRTPLEMEVAKECAMIIINK